MESIDQCSVKDFSLCENKILALVPLLRNILLEKHEVEIPEKCNDFLLRCLRVKDGEVEAAAKLASSFKAMTTEYLKWNVFLLPSLYKNSFYDNHILFPLRKPDSQGPRVFIIQTSNWNPKELNFAEIMTAGLLIFQYAISHNISDQRNGFMLIWNFTGFSSQQLLAIQNLKLLTMALSLQRGQNGKMKGLHAVNHPMAIKFVYGGLKPFLSQKMKKRICLHDSLDSLHKSIGFDPKLLPDFLGGDFEIDDCVDKKFLADLANSDDFFQDMFSNGYPRR